MKRRASQQEARRFSDRDGEADIAFVMIPPRWLGRPERLPLGAATGTPASLISSLATGCEGMRSATVSSPPVVA